MKKVTAAIMEKDGLIFIAKRSSRDKLANMWEFPGGKIENGETPEECLRREMNEEFGIDVSVGDFFGESVYNYEQGTITLLAYWTYWITGELTPTVHDEIAWVKPDHLDHYDFAPADVPLVNSLKNNRLKSKLK